MAELRDLVPSEFKDDLSEAENLILENAPKGEFADMRSGDEEFDKPENSDKWPESRTVRAKFLEWLLRDKKAQKLIHDKGVRIKGIKVAEELDLACIRLPFPIELFYCRFEGRLNLYFANVRAINLDSSFIAGMIASFMIMEGSLFLENIRSQGEIRLVGANIGGNLSCTGAKFKNESGNAFTGDGIATKGNISLHQIESTGNFRLVRANIGGNLSCDGAKFINEEGESFNAGTMITKGTVFLPGIESRGKFGLIGANIGGNLQCEGAKFVNGKGKAFTGDAFNVGENILLYDIDVTGQFRLVSSTVGGGIFSRGAMFKFADGTALYLTETNIRRRLCLDGIKKIDGTIDLESTKAGAFRDDAESWPDQGNLMLDGFEYGSFADNTPTDVKTRLQWLKRQPQKQYFPQPYQQLAKVYRNMGRDRDAERILIERERMRRRYANIGILARLWGMLLDLTIDYGYRKSKAFVFAVAIILWGTMIFQTASYMGVMKLARTEMPENKTDVYENNQKDIPEFSALFYSIDLFIPYVDLKQARHWEPDKLDTFLGSITRSYILIHKGLGWIISTLSVILFPALIRKELTN